MTTLSLHLYSGCGNSFLLIDNRQQELSEKIASSLAITLCRVQKLADGVVLLESSQTANYRMRIFNPDGSEAEMCGNGLRCLVRFIIDLGDKRKHWTIETMERLLKAQEVNGSIAVFMGAANLLSASMVLVYEKIPIELTWLNTGVPHAVLFDLDERLDFLTVAPFIRYHSSMGAKGTNVNLIKRLENSLFQIRTFERGVEAETLACGTGATAAALAAAVRWRLPAPLTFMTASGQPLQVHFQGTDFPFEEVWLEGAVTFHRTFSILKNSIERKPLDVLDLAQTLSEIP